jgi:hypothetical protein
MHRLHSSIEINIEGALAVGTVEELHWARA